MNKTVERIKKALASLNGKELYVALALIALLAAICIFGKGFSLVTKSENNDSSSVASNGAYSYCENMQREISEAVKMMCDSAKCKVIINWAEDELDVPSYVVTNTKEGETKTPQIITVNGAATTVSLGKTHPTAISCAIVCPKSTSIRQRLDIKYLVNTLIGCDFDNIVIYDC